MRGIPTCAWTLPAVLLVALAAPAAWGEEASSLDEELMRQLRGESIDDVDRELFGPSKPEPGATRPDSKEGRDRPGAGADDLERVRRELGTAAVSEEDNPLLSVARQMREVEGLLARAQSGSRTQQVQSQIVAELEALIDQARKSAAKCQGGSPQPQQATASRDSGKPAARKPGDEGSGRRSKPAATSDARPSAVEAGAPRPEDMKTLIKEQVWGILPERERQRMLELPIEEFLPKYEPLIIEYYRRLSKEQGGGGPSWENRP